MRTMDKRRLSLGGHIGMVHLLAGRGLLLSRSATQDGSQHEKKMRRIYGWLMG